MISIKILNDKVKQEQLQPQHNDDCGVDLRALETVTIPAGGRHLFGLGIAIQPILPNTAGFIYSRSGLGSKGLAVANGVGVIDPQYTGELKAMMHNTTSEDWTVQEGERICQLVIQNYHAFHPVFVEHLKETERGGGGFGSTGTK